MQPILMCTIPASGNREDAFKRRGMYPNVSKCNAKRCVCCAHLCTKTTITSSVNGRKFSIINDNDLD